MDQLELAEKIYEDNLRKGGYYVTIRIQNGDRVVSESHPALSSGDRPLERLHNNLHIIDIEGSPNTSERDFLKKIRNHFGKKET